MTYTCTDDERAVALCVATRRNTLNGGRSNLLVETMTPDDRLRQHERACLAEIGVSRITNLAWTGCGKGSTGIHDVGNFIEVRTQRPHRTTPGLICRTRDTKDVPFVLCDVEAASGRVTARGWAWMSDVKRLGTLMDGDSDKPYWILHDLEPMDTLLSTMTDAPF